MVCVVIALWGLSVEKIDDNFEESEPPPEIQKSVEEIRAEKIKEYLEIKKSPLSEHAEKLACQKHWRILIAISKIESQFCKKKKGFNCWGIGGTGKYRTYSGYDEAITDANDFIERWQQRGRWLTIEDMNGHYVQPKNDNWERVVKATIKELEDIK